MSSAPGLARPHGFLRLAATVAAATALLVLAGWSLHIEPLKTVLPGFVAMNPATAVAFLALGAGLALAAEPRTARASQALGLVAAALGAWKLLELAAILPVGPDRLLFAGALEAYATPNRMAPNTAANFVLLGAALVLVHRGPIARAAAQVLACASALVALLVLVGYAYGVTQLQGLAAFIPMALHTAGGFLLVAAGVLAARPRDGFVAFVTADNAGGRLARLLLPLAIVLPIVLGWLRLQGEYLGLYSAEFGVAIFVLSMILIFGAVILFHARSVGRADEARLQAEREAAESLRRAMEATRSKSEFLANMSHEIRTPLNAVVGMTDLLMDTPLTEQQRDYASTIRASGEHLMTIISDILDLSKVEAGKLDLESRPVELRDVAERAIEMLGPAATAKGLDMVFDADPSLPHAVASDEVRLRQVLVNLLSNAVKFTSRGEIVLTGSGRRLQDGRFEVTFEVKDQGIGIPPERLAKLFQPFTQADASTTRVHGGTGLGLAISRRIVDLMGGRIEAESQLGVGSTFRFTLVAPAADAPQRPMNASPRLHGRRVLVVDDTPANRRVVHEHLRSWGMLPEATASPVEALEWVREGRPYDAAIVDHHMPEMDGETLAREMLRLRGPEFPVILLSSMTSRRGGAPFVLVLSKPLKASTLFDALIGTFAREAAPASEAPHPHEEAPKPARILLVEDNIVNQKVASLMLKRIGYTPEIAPNGAEALRMVLENPYDIVLMDIQMPEMDGLEATRRIRAELPDRRPRIIALTAHALSGERERCLAAGMDDYLTKPLDAAKLRTAIAQALEEA